MWPEFVSSCYSSFARPVYEKIDWPGGRCGSDGHRFLRSFSTQLQKKGEHLALNSNRKSKPCAEILKRSLVVDEVKVAGNH